MQTHALQQVSIRVMRLTCPGYALGGQHQWQILPKKTLTRARH
jgi:hypothetical protein